MKPSIASKLAQLSARLEELNALLSGEDVTRNLDNYRKLTREHAEITPVVELYKAYKAAEGDVASALQLAGDPEMRELAEAEVAELDDVFLYSVDDLGKIVQEGLDTRQAAVAQAEAIINASVHDFMHWFETRELVPTIRALRDQAERMRRHEFDRAAKLLAKGEDPQKVLEQLSHALTNKFLHAPTHALNAAEARERDTLVAALARIYQVNPPE